MDRGSQLDEEDEEDDEEEDDEEEDEEERRKRRTRQEEATDIKSNNPHLAGGEIERNDWSIALLNWVPARACFWCHTRPKKKLSSSA